MNQAKPYRSDRHAALAACSSDACQQGRKACPVPSACRVPEVSMWDVERAHPLLLLVYALGFVAGCAGFAIFAH